MSALVNGLPVKTSTGRFERSDETQCRYAILAALCIFGKGVEGLGHGHFERSEVRLLLLGQVLVDLNLEVSIFDRVDLGIIDMGLTIKLLDVLDQSLLRGPLRLAGFGYRCTFESTRGSQQN